MTASNNIYMTAFEGITSASANQVREKIISDAKILGLEDSYLLAEISHDKNLTLDELIDILSFESEENPKLKKLVMAIQVNLKKSRLSQVKPINEAQLDKEISHIETGE